MRFQQDGGIYRIRIWGRRTFNNIESHGGRRKAVEDDGKQSNGSQTDHGSVAICIPGPLGPRL